MKKLLITSIMVFVSSALLLASGIEGKWEASVDTGNGVWEFTITYKVDGDKLSGTFSSEQRAVTFTDGTVRGKDFEYKIGEDGNMFVHKGKLVNEDELLITWEHDSYGEGKFKMTRVQE